MKTRLIYILIPIAGLGLCTLVYMRAGSAQPSPEPEAIVSEIVDATPEPPVVIEKERDSIPEPLVIEPENKTGSIAIVPTPAPVPEPIKPVPLSAEEQRRLAINRYYDEMERIFEQQLNLLKQETDPARRASIIQALGRYVRVDTVETLDWATGLEDRDEQRAALEAINKNALTGIGARIEMDDYGLPKIKDTTILSAAEATGQIQAGDYISGMITADGSAVSFRGMSMQQIVNYLRGQPGSNIQLRMERSPEYGSSQPIPFEVPLQRSLIVMQRPTDG